LERVLLKIGQFLDWSVQGISVEAVHVVLAAGRMVEIGGVMGGVLQMWTNLHLELVSTGLESLVVVSFEVVEVKTLNLA